MTITTAPPAVEAVANILLECRIGGIVEEHPSSGTVMLRAYLPAGPASAVTLDAIADRVHTLPSFGLDIGAGHIGSRTVEDSGWADAWKVSFKPFPVGRRFWIKPTWDDQPVPPDRVRIELDPGMAFGSGLHPSTQLCLRVLEDRLVPASRVVDVGTGSGILAIAAARLGAVKVFARDSDPVAIGVARGNVRRNGVESIVVVEEASLLEGIGGPVDMIAANLTADIHLDLLPTARHHLTPNGLLAASGIVTDRAPEVRAVAKAAGLEVVDEFIDADWRCLLVGR